MKRLTERQIFELWAKRQGYDLERATWGVNSYAWVTTNEVYLAWKAGRAEIRRAARRAVDSA